jgi:formylglycine-generating enzyme required for sulfatase activity
LQSIPDTTTSHPVPAPEEYQELAPEALRTRLPLLVPLREFWTTMECDRGRRDWRRSDLERALGAWIDRSPPPGLSALLKAHLVAGSAFLLLDGLDEVAIAETRGGTTVYPRALLLSGLADALPAWEAAGNRTLLTSRPHGLDEAGLARLPLPRAPLEPLPQPLQELFVRRWFHTLKREELAGHLLEAIAYGMHTGEPNEGPRQTPAAEISWNETERLLAQFAEKNPSFGQGEVAAAVHREELLTRSGLLLPQPNERVAFYHLSFQEFLAAQRNVRTSDDLKQVFFERGTVSEWRPTLLFLFAAQIFNKDPDWSLNLLTRLLESQNRAAVKANPAPALFIGEALQLCLAKRYQIPHTVAESFRRLSLGAIEDEIELRSRQALGLCLGQLGDPRIFDLRDPRAYVEVPAGTYPYGDEGEKVEFAAPFLLGRYPVTNSQYQAFIDDGGYSARKCWSDEGWTWLKRERVTGPHFWRRGRQNGPNQPVICVSFWEAEACCAWASGRLPRAEEWEAAARGPDGCEYPWCGEWEDGICNSEQAGLGATSPVGLFPRSGQARLDLHDLTGNVWEFSSDADLGDTARCKLRGGSWETEGPALLGGADRTMRFPFFGFRVVRSSASQEP